MSETKPQNLAFRSTVIFLRKLWATGLDHVVISPGSRSTPLTLAAASLPQLKKHVVLDERSAAFLALGIGKATNKPAGLICTSGTAVASYFPAVIEARKSGIPLLLLTADRPLYLHGTGANQTIDQQNIFGDYPVLFEDVGEPPPGEKELDNLKKLATRSFHYSIDKQGPVHLNFPFRKPLEPTQRFFAAITEENQNLSRRSSLNSSRKRHKSFSLNDDILYEIHATDKPLIVIGQLTPATKLKYIYWLAEWLEAPVLSEQGIVDPEYAIQGFDGFLRNQTNQSTLEPDLILRFGRQPASKSLLKAIKNWSPKRHIYFSDSGQRSDIANSVTNHIEWDGNYFDANKFPEKPTGWLTKWKDVGKKYFKKTKVIFNSTNTITDGLVYHQLSSRIPENWTIFVSNSFAARDQSLFARWKTQKLFTNRGASGIDGVTSAAMGVNIGLNKPGILFTGDLAFLHDTNALLNAHELRQPLVVVVINNRGGSLFRMLPIVDYETNFTPYFETPQQANIAELAASYGVNTSVVQTLTELDKINFEQIVFRSGSKLTVIECQTDPDVSMEVRNELWNFEL